MIGILPCESVLIITDQLKQVVDLCGSFVTSIY